MSNSYFDISELEDVTDEDRRREKAGYLIERAFERKDVRFKRNPRLVFDLNNIEVDRFTVTEARLQENSGTYTFIAVGMYTTKAPMLNEEMRVDPEDPIKNVTLEDTLVTVVVKYNRRSTVEDISAWVHAEALLGNGSKIEIEDKDIDDE